MLSTADHGNTDTRPPVPIQAFDDQHCFNSAPLKLRPNGAIQMLLLLSRSTQPCIPPGSLNRVPASAGVKAGKSPLPGGR